KAIADQICIHDETIDDTKPLKIFDQYNVWKSKTITDFTAKELLKPIFINGEQVYDCPPISEVREYCLEQIDTLWDEVKRFENPHSYYVDLSQKLWKLKNNMLEEHKK
ncbi:MAG: nicotinate phosphoribosyltransferase, partial [Oscillospiraceae bacterium]|nr:nicotinate phosphoribosyltransferase [Oscillospiraceae bacterium]